MEEQDEIFGELYTILRKITDQSGARSADEIPEWNSLRPCERDIFKITACQLDMNIALMFKTALEAIAAHQRQHVARYN